MQKGKNVLSLVLNMLMLVCLSSAPWPLTQADDSVVLRPESPAKEIATMMNAQFAKETPVQSGKESPFACNMLALDAAGRRRHKEVAKQMRAATKEVQALPDGYAFRFAAEQSTILLASELDFIHLRIGSLNKRLTVAAACLSFQMSLEKHDV